MRKNNALEVVLIDERYIPDGNFLPPFGVRHVSGLELHRCRHQKSHLFVRYSLGVIALMGSIEKCLAFQETNNCALGMYLATPDTINVNLMPARFLMPPVQRVPASKQV